MKSTNIFWMRGSIKKTQYPHVPMSLDTTHFKFYFYYQEVLLVEYHKKSSTMTTLESLQVRKRVCLLPRPWLLFTMLQIILLGCPTVISFSLLGTYLLLQVFSE